MIQDAEKDHDHIDKVKIAYAILYGESSEKDLNLSLEFLNSLTDQRNEPYVIILKAKLLQASINKSNESIQIDSIMNYYLQAIASSDDFALLQFLYYLKSLLKDFITYKKVIQNGINLLLDGQLDIILALRPNSNYFKHIIYQYAFLMNYPIVKNHTALRKKALEIACDNNNPLACLELGNKMNYKKNFKAEFAYYKKGLKFMKTQILLSMFIPQIYSL